MTSARDRDVPQHQRCPENATGNVSLVDPSARPHADFAFDHPLHALDSLAGAVGVHLDRLGVQRSDWQRVAKVGEEGGEVVGAFSNEPKAELTPRICWLNSATYSWLRLAAADQLGVTRRRSSPRGGPMSHNDPQSGIH